MAGPRSQDPPARSESGDSLYGKTRPREIDRRIRFLSKRLERSEVVDPAKRPKTDQVFFGATVTWANSKGDERTIKIVGIDEVEVSLQLETRGHEHCEQVLRSLRGKGYQLKFT